MSPIVQLPNQSQGGKEHPQTHYTALNLSFERDLLRGDPSPSAHRSWIHPHGTCVPYAATPRRREERRSR